MESPNLCISYLLESPSTRNLLPFNFANSYRWTWKYPVLMFDLLLQRQCPCLFKIRRQTCNYFFQKLFFWEQTPLKILGLKFVDVFLSKYKLLQYRNYGECLCILHNYECFYELFISNVSRMVESLFSQELLPLYNFWYELKKVSKLYW